MPETLLGNVFNMLRLVVVLTHIVHYRLDCLAAKKVDSGIGFRVTAYLYHAFPKRGEGGSKVACYGRFANAALTINC